MLSLWGGGGYGISPYSTYELYQKHEYFKKNRNPAGACRSGLNFGYPLYCTTGLRERDGKCAVKRDFHLYGIDGSSFIVNSLKEMISHRLAPDVSKMWSVFNFAVSDKTGFAEFTKQNETVMAGFEGGYITQKKNKYTLETEKVPMTTLDIFTQTFVTQPTVDIIKIDAEGLDSEVINGAKKMIKTHRVGIIIWESGNPNKLELNLKYLEAKKFDCYSPHIKKAFVKLTGGCVSKLQRGGNIFCVSRRYAAGVALAFEALSAYHLPSQYNPIL
jgi:FkbM family methyltransferase